jgi:hypothetical protein
MLRFAVVVSFFLLLLAPAKANDFMELSGANRSIDKAIDGLQAVVDRARAAAFALEAQANNDAKERLADIDTIVRQANADLMKLENATAEDINRIAAIYFDRLDALAGQTMIRLKELVDQAECAARKTIDESLREVIGTSILALHNDILTITPPVMYEGERQCRWLGLFNCGPVTKDFVIRNPFGATYLEIRDYLEGRLTKGATDKTPMRSIVRTYTLTADLARRTACYEVADADTYYKQFELYSSKARPWKVVFDQM